MYQEALAPLGPDDRYAGIRALWLKVIIRAIFDWITYRDSTRLQQKKLAEQAYAWLFKPSQLFNSFDNVCRYLDIDPGVVRGRAMKMTRYDVAKIEHLERSSEPDICAIHSLVASPALLSEMRDD